MAYERQINEHMERLDQSLAQLYTLIKNGKQQEALDFMDKGPFKDRYEELQNIIKISSVGTLGARGTNQTGTF